MRLIDADELMKKARWSFPDFMVAITDVQSMIKSAPTIEPAQGEWIEEKFFLEDDPEHEWFRRVCSVCGWEKTIGTGGTRYCPRCGMKGGEA